VKTIVSDRLILRPISDGELAFVASLLARNDRTHYLFGGVTMDLQQAARFVNEHFTDEEAPVGMGVLVRKSDRQLVGFAGIIPTSCIDAKDDFEFGFVLSHSADGNAYATEIGYTQMQYAFETLRLTRILALAHPDNGASVRILRDKLKMTEALRLGRTTHRGPRIVFRRCASEGLPKVHGKAWSVNK
jgi:RimJ/RimL family protein N-acetyltransferase